MCGYIGGPKDILLKNGIEALLFTQIHRGTDGYGSIAIYEDGASKAFKSMKKDGVIDWINTLVGNPFIFIHHRATSVGGTKISLAHPLAWGTTILMQNGTNRDPFDMIEGAESDSEALCMLANAMEPNDFALYILTGVGVVLYRKQGKFYLHRDSSRPLNEHESGLLCSEPLVAGKWRQVSEGFYNLEYKNGILEGLNYKEHVDITSIGSVKWCTTCKSRHLIQSGCTVCNVCLANGKIQLKDFSYPSRGSWDDDVDYYDTNWERGVGSRHERATVGKTRGGTGRMSVFTLVPSSTPKVDELKKVEGVPLNIDGDFYIVAGTELDTKNMYYVVEEMHRIEQCQFYKGGWVPKSTEDPIVLTSFDFSPYWNEEEGCFDLFKETYYQEPTALFKADMDILVFDKYMDSYIVPMLYNYMPESYNMGCSNC